MTANWGKPTLANIDALSSSESGSHRNLLQQLFHFGEVLDDAAGGGHDDAGEWCFTLGSQPGKSLVKTSQVVGGFGRHLLK